MSANDSAPHQASSRKTVLLAACVIAVLVVATLLYWHYSDLRPSTDDAYIHAEVLSVAPQVAGQVLSVHVDDFQHVNRGDLLLRIDPQAYTLALKQAQAAYQLALQQHQMEDSQVAVAVAAVEAARAQLTEAQLEYDRQIELVRRNLAAAQTGDTFKNQLAQAQSKLDESRASLQSAISSRGADGLDAAVVQQAAARLGQAELDLSYTELTAPFDGFLGEVTTQQNAVVGVGQQLFPLVKDGSYWVQANYKETDMARLQEGQPARVEVDMYPGYEWQGRVDKISPASGNAFSLLPPENATGNWVKIKQRFPVKIRLEPNDDAPPLRIGASAIVTVDTTQK
ncbi:membrane fusion protein (multidrug efflux system) [Sinobacterium caligoides]|uniref:Membrane fusion protein (Multidrug efflux system) n=1 Tax=Sinobacterium caligoides TaxID=933926 RepID=A0A3N2E1F3_9GAMM|nr:HlyD family secretion protein [Sinobacterium caligoides]ROS05479.1 membrane fusion protein (multidrug efflux system) [Sinobacterium caligoides]